MPMASVLATAGAMAWLKMAEFLHGSALTKQDESAPSSGAYCLAMSSNYNLVPRPAVVLVNDGNARLIRRRETLDDLIQPHLEV